MPVFRVDSVYFTSGNSRRIASTCRVLASVAWSEEPTGVWKESEVSEKSALGTNSVPSSGTMNRLPTKMASARPSVASLCFSDQRSVPW
ncbi:hypothetical protein D9M68_860800 [compost metagenome]